ncbi:MAG TPA: hypothetical protein VMB28_40540 [Mycobacterium sp.]|nr:hypothetical protein [Mycobacterium sp.]HTH91382.1 hypothetical protein [Mycobacterium sp.]
MSERSNPIHAPTKMGATAFGVPRTQIAFSAHGGWDAAGASVYGYPS